MTFLVTFTTGEQTRVVGAHSEEGVRALLSQLYPLYEIAKVEIEYDPKEFLE